LRYGKGWKSQKQNYDSKYADLNKKHRALKEKMFQLEKKFIDLTISTSVPELNSNRTQQLEKQLSESKAKEVKLLKEVMKFKQIKQEVIEEKLQLQERLNNSEMVIDTLVDTMTKYT
jgi:chromosome segregation ATPase